MSNDCKDTLRTQNRTVWVWRSRTSKVSIRHRRRQSCQNVSGKLSELVHAFQHCVSILRKWVLDTDSHVCICIRDLSGNPIDFGVSPRLSVLMPGSLACVWTVSLTNQFADKMTWSQQHPFLLPVRQYGTVCLSLSDQLRLLLILSASWKPICSTFRFNWLLSFINIVMPSRSIFVVGWALN